MSVIRVNKTKNYSVMSNYHLRDKNLSLKAKGLLSVMLSLPDDFNYSMEALVTLSKDNETSINSTLKELKETCYLIVTKLMPNQTSSGRIEYIYDIYENPKQDGKKQDLEILGVEIQGVENQGTYINTNNINTNSINTNNIENNKLPVLPYKEIVDYLNEKTNKHFKPSSDLTRRLIKARFNDGFTLEDFKKVIDNKCSQWLGDSRMVEYLRPETLFSNKFESYLNCTSENKPTSNRILGRLIE